MDQILDQSSYPVPLDNNNNDDSNNNNNLAIIKELLQENPTLACSFINQLLQEGSLDGSSMEATSIVDTNQLANLLQSVSTVQSQNQAQQEFLRRPAYEQLPTFENIGKYNVNQMAQLQPGLSQMPPHDLTNMPIYPAANAHENIRRYIQHQDKFLVPTPSSPGSSSPTSSRFVRKQISMPGKQRPFVPDLDFTNTLSSSPFTSTSDYPTEIHSAHSVPHSALHSATHTARRRANSDPMLSQDLDVLKPDDLKHMLQKWPAIYNVASVIAPFLPQMDVKSCCQLLKGLGKSNLHSRAWQIFQLIREVPVGSPGFHLRAVEVYNQMIQLCQNNTYNALQVYQALIEDNLVPDASVYGSLINTCNKCDDFERAEVVYKEAREQNCIDKEISAAMVDMYSKSEQWHKVTFILEDLKLSGVELDVQLYNSVINSACKKRQFHVALNVYMRIFEDDLLPSHKTLLVIRPAVEALFSSEQMLETSSSESSDSQEIIRSYMELIIKHSPEKARSTLFQILMTSFDKQGEVGYATSLYDCLKQSGACGKLSLEFCNIAISACAHQGFYRKAQTIFDDMCSSCEVGPQAVTYANLLRAYKKGGQWCSAIVVFEKMKEAGHVPHGAVYGSCLDLCWKAGVPWALAKASEILIEGFQSSLLDEPQEVLQRNTLRLDLRALTCGAAVLTMRQWLFSIRERFSTNQDPNLMCVKRLVVVNGVGEGTKGQTSCTVVKNAVAASLSGHRSPFTLTQDSRLLKLEAQMPLLREWVLSPNFESYYTSFGTPNTQLLPSIQYVEVENKIEKECTQLFNQLCRQQAMARPNLQAMHPDYVQVRLSLIVQQQELHHRLNLSDLSLFSSVLLMDILMSGQMLVNQWEMVRLPMLCAHFIHSADDANASSALFAGLAQCNSEQFNALIQKFARLVPQPVQFLVTPIHFLRLFTERLGYSMEEPSVQAQLAVCSQLVLDVISQPASVQFPASVLAPAVLKVFRKQISASPEWPSVLAQLTSYNEENTNLIECEKVVMISRGRLSSIRGGAQQASI